MNKEETMNDIIQYANELKLYCDDDNIIFKEKIKNSLLNCYELLFFLNNDKYDFLDESDMYFGTNIKPFIHIPETNTSASNYICYKTEFSNVLKDYELLKLANITFVIICSQDTIIDKYTGIARHDLLGSILRAKFNWSNIFGMQCKLVSDRESVTDSRYSTRTLQFELTKPNSIAKNGKVLNTGLNYSKRDINK